MQLTIRHVLLGAVALAGLSFGFLALQPEPKPQPVVDSTFGAYTHLYIFRDAETKPWHFSTKDQGPITDLDNVPMQATPDAQHPGCIQVAFTFDPNKDLGMRWNDARDGGRAISSRSQSLRILACQAVIPQLEAFRGPDE